jgi:hypothetical protein
LQVEFVARLASSLGVELVKAESLRVRREGANNPDAVDLAMRGWAILYSNPNGASAASSAHDVASAIWPSGMRRPASSARVLEQKPMRNSTYRPRRACIAPWANIADTAGV